MSEYKRILIVEDDKGNALLLKRLLSRGSYHIRITSNGKEAKEILEKEVFDAVLTDWMMPIMDGIELIKYIRNNIKPSPFIVMITALVSESAREYSLECGADDFITKPIDFNKVLELVEEGLNRVSQKTIIELPTKRIATPKKLPPFPAIAIASSTGGPSTLIELFKNFDPMTKASIFIVQHGPAWMLETFTDRLAKEGKFKVFLGADNLIPEMGKVYLAPGDKHMVIDEDTFRIKLDDGPKENFVKPAADPLFRSVAKVFGRYSVAVVLTGLGSDGANGLLSISQVKGSVLIQDPTTAIAPSMPTAAVGTKVQSKIMNVKDIGKALSDMTFPMYALLKKNI